MKNLITGTIITFGILVGINQAKANEEPSLIELLNMSKKTMPIAFLTIGSNIHCTQSDKEWNKIQKIIEMGKATFDEKHLNLYNKQVINFTKKAKDDNVQPIGCKKWLKKMSESK